MSEIECFGDVSCGFNPAEETLYFQPRTLGNDLYEAVTLAVVHAQIQLKQHESEVSKEGSLSSDSDDENIHSEGDYGRDKNKKHFQRHSNMFHNENNSLQDQSNESNNLNSLSQNQALNYQNSNQTLNDNKILRALDESKVSQDFDNQKLRKDKYITSEASNMIFKKCKKLKETIISVNRNNRQYLATEKILHIFEDLMCSKLFKQYSFEYQINAIYVFEDGDNVLVYLDNHTIAYINIMHGSIQITKDLHEILTPLCKCINIFAHSEDNVVLVYIIFDSGTLISIRLNLTENTFGDSVICQLKDTLKYSSCNEKTELLIVGEKFIYKYDMKKEKISLQEINNCKWKKMYSVNQKLCLGITKLGNLCFYCTVTGLSMPFECNYLFDDIILVSEGHKMGIVAHTFPDEENRTYLQFYKFSSMKMLFSIKQSNTIILTIPSTVTGDIMYVEITERDIFVKNITETNVEDRLLKLLERECFEIAEAFAQEHLLDMQIVYKHRAEFYVHKLICNSKEVDTLILELNKIIDVNFVIDCCLNTTCIGFLDVQRIFFYAFERAKMNSKEIITTSDIYNVLQRLDTFHILNDAKEDDKLLMQKWKKFQDADLILSISSYISNSEFANAIILFRRLDAKTRSEIDSSAIFLLLSEIPTDVDFKACISFLKEFTIIALPLAPDSLPEIINFIEKKIKQIEKEDMHHFPENALDCLEQIIPEILKTYDEIYKDDYEKLRDIKYYLNQIQVLKTHYSILMTLEAMMQNSHTLAVTLVTKKIEDDFDKFWKGFLNRFFIENNIIGDEILSDVIEVHISICEESAINLLKYMESLDVKMYVIIKLLENADIPWNQSVQQLANDAMKEKHPGVETIKEVIAKVPVRYVLKKYCYNINLFKNSEVLYFIQRIIVVNKPSKLQDIKDLCGSDKNLLLKGLQYCVYDHIEKGEFNEALGLVDDHPEFDTDFCHYFSITLRCLLSHKKHMAETLKKFIEISNAFQHRAKRLKGKFQYLASLIAELKCMYYKDGKHEQDLIAEILVNESISDDENICQSVIKASKNIGSNVEESLITLMKNTKKKSLLLKAGSHIYENSKNSDYLCQATMLLLKSTEPESLDETNNLEVTILPEAKDLNSLMSFEDVPNIKIIKLVQKSVNKAVISYIAPVGLSNCLHLADWVAWLYLVTQKRTENECSPQVSLNLFHKVFNIYQNLCLKVPITYGLKYLTLGNKLPLSIEQLEKEIHSLWTIAQETETNFEILQMFQNLIIFLNKSCTAYNKKISTSLLTQFNKLIKSMDKRLLHKLLMDKKDCNQMALLFLTRMEPNEVDNYLDCYLKHAIRNDVDQFYFISKLLVSFKNIFRNDSISTWEYTLPHCKWWKRFQNCGLSFLEFYKMRSKELFEFLLNKEVMSLQYLQEFCNDYGLSLKTCGGLWLSKKLLNWSPVYSVILKSHGERVLNMAESNLYSDCLPIVLSFKNKQQIITLLKDLWNNVNFYHYEVYHCIYQLLCALNTTDDFELKTRHMILIFLSEYTRESVPCEREHELWSSTFPKATQIDPLSEWRFPNILGSNKINVLEIIKAEITLSNYKQWFSSTDILNLNKNDICIYAINNTVLKNLASPKKDEVWFVGVKNVALLEKIRECVHYINNSEDATAILNSVLNNTSGGGDLVEITKLCYEYASKWMEQICNEKVKQAFLKIQKKYYINSTTHVLHSNCLAEEKYLNYVGDYNKLVEILYNDVNISEYLIKEKNINQAVDEISIIYEENAEGKRFEILNQWLAVYSTNTKDKQLFEGNLKKMVYMCKCRENSGLVNYLVGLIIPETISYEHTSRTTYNEQVISDWNLSRIDTKQVNYNTRYYVLRCLMQTLNSDELEKKTCLTVIELRNMMVKFQILCGLVSILGLALTPETLEDYNKSTLIQSLSRCRNNQIESVRLLSDICRYYKLYKINYWEFIIERMTVLNMANDLHKNLTFLCKTNTDIITGNLFAKAWEKSMELRIRNFKLTENDSIDKACKDAFIIFMECPKFTTLNIENICNLFIEFGKYEYAVLVIMFVQEENKRRCWLEKISSGRKNLIIEKLESLQDIFPVKMAMKYIEEY